MDELIIHRCDLRIENNTKLWICHNEKNDKSWNCPFSLHCHTNTWILGMKIVLLLEEVRIRCAGGSFQKIDKHHQHFGLNTSKNLNFRCQLLRFRIYRRIQITFSNYHHFGTFFSMSIQTNAWCIYIYIYTRYWWHRNLRKALFFWAPISWVKCCFCTLEVPNSYLMWPRSHLKETCLKFLHIHVLSFLRL